MKPNPAPALLLLAPLLTLATPAPAAAALEWRDQPYVTHEREPRTIVAQAARLRVPEDPARPGGPQIELALLRLPATTRAPGPPVVYLHGGPGGSGPEHLELPEFRAVFDSLRGVGDVILLDQRGCGASTPSLRPEGAPPPAGDALATREGMVAWFTAMSATVRDRLRASGHDPRLYTTAASAEDLEALRRALGVPAVNVFAHSYGTQLAQAFVRAHPGSVARMVLAGPRGMDTARKRPAEADAALARIAALARADSAVGAATPDLVGRLRRVLDRLDREPLPVELDAGGTKLVLRVGGDAARFIVAKFYLNDPDNFRYLPKFLAEIDDGRRPWSLVFNLGQILRSTVSLAWFTTDAASGVSAARAAAIAAEAPASPLRDMLNFPFPEIEPAWEMPDAGDAFRAPVAWAGPVLVVAGTLDGLTPPAQARALLPGFPAGRLLVVENGGHVSQLRAPRVAGAVAGFLAGREPPAADTLPPPAFAPLVTPAPARAR